jgi:hypothetical protein
VVAIAAVPVADVAETVVVRAEIAAARVEGEAVTGVVVLAADAVQAVIAVADRPAATVAGVPNLQLPL